MSELQKLQGILFWANLGMAVINIVIGNYWIVPINLVGVIVCRMTP
jgi:hypothetical protein